MGNEELAGEVIGLFISIWAFWWCVKFYRELHSQKGKRYDFFQNTMPRAILGFKIFMPLVFVILLLQIAYIVVSMMLGS